MGGRGSISGKAGSGTGNREVREYNNTKINQGQQDVIKRLNKKMPVGSNTPPMFGGGVLMEPIKYTLQADGTIEYKAKTMKLNSGVESATIGVGSISPNVRIYETTGRIMRDANVNNMRYSLMRLKGEKLVDKALSKKEYKEYEEMLQKSKTR